PRCLRRCGPASGAPSTSTQRTRRPERALAAVHDGPDTRRQRARLALRSMDESAKGSRRTRDYCTPIRAVPLAPPDAAVIVGRNLAVVGIGVSRPPTPPGSSTRPRRWWRRPTRPRPSEPRREFWATGGVNPCVWLGRPTGGEGG